MILPYIYPKCQVDWALETLIPDRNRKCFVKQNPTLFRSQV